MKVRFNELIGEAFESDDAKALSDYLETTDFYTAPASTRFHGNYEGLSQSAVILTLLPALPEESPRHSIVRFRK